jgi:hypothetical protein
MAHGLGSGDRLARGAVSASYLTTEKKISDKKWSEMFDDFDPEEFKKTGMPKMEGVAKERRK